MRVSTGMAIEATTLTSSKHPLTPGLAASPNKVKPTDIFDLRATLEALSPADRFIALQTPVVSSGLMPLLHAVMLGQPQLAALLVGAGASFATPTVEGLNAMHVALRHLQMPTAKWLLRTREAQAALVEKTTWKSSESIRAELDSLGPTPTDKQLDRCAAMLTGRPRRFFKRTDALLLYLSHATSLKTTPYKARVEGWNVRAHMSMRVRSLCSFYTKLVDPTARRKVADEISCNLEIMREDARLYSIIATVDETVRKDALKVEVDSIIERMKTAFAAGTSFALPLTTKEHAIYLGFDRDGDTLTIHVDNRMGGAKLHLTVGPDVYPVVMQIPSSDKGYAALRAFLNDVYAITAKGNMNDVYGTIEGHVASWLGKFDREVYIDPRSNQEWVALAQLAGNCTYSSMVPGSQRRLGILLNIDFRQHEVNEVLERAETSFDKQHLLRPEVQKRLAELEPTLLRSRARDTT